MIILQWNAIKAIKVRGKPHNIKKEGEADD